MVRICNSDLLVFILVILCTVCSALNLNDLLHTRFRPNHEKRGGGKGNPCDQVEDPFPCKDSDICIPMGYVCDENWDCPDGFDENKQLCAAAKRPPIKDLENFLENEKSWIMKNVFRGLKIETVAHALTVSADLDDFRRNVGYSIKEIKPFMNVLRAVQFNKPRLITAKGIGMPHGSWEAVKTVFDNLLKSGFKLN